MDGDGISYRLNRPSPRAHAAREDDSLKSSGLLNSKPHAAEMILLPINLVAVMEFKFPKNPAGTGLTQNETRSTSRQVVFQESPLLR
jgi:hypothetical protein